MEVDTDPRKSGEHFARQLFAQFQEVIGDDYEWREVHKATAFTSLTCDAQEYLIATQPLRVLCSAFVAECFFACCNRELESYCDSGARLFLRGVIEQLAACEDPPLTIA